MSQSVRNDVIDALVLGRVRQSAKTLQWVIGMFYNDTQSCHQPIWVRVFQVNKILRKKAPKEPNPLD